MQTRDGTKLTCLRFRLQSTLIVKQIKVGHYQWIDSYLGPPCVHLFDYGFLIVRHFYCIKL